MYMHIRMRNVVPSNQSEHFYAVKVNPCTRLNYCAKN